MTQAIETRYIGPTNTRGARIVAECEAMRKVFPWDYASDVELNHYCAAVQLATILGWAAIPGRAPSKQPRWITGSLKRGTYVHVRVTE